MARDSDGASHVHDFLDLEAIANNDRSTDGKACDSDGASHPYFFLY